MSQCPVDCRGDGWHQMLLMFSCGRNAPSLGGVIGQMRQLSFTGLVTILKFSEVQISTLWGHKIRHRGRGCFAIQPVCETAADPAIPLHSKIVLETGIWRGPDISQPTQQAQHNKKID